MKWAKTTQYQASIQLEGRIYNILCKQDFDDGFSIYANGEFIADFDELPCRDELVDAILEYNRLESNVINDLSVTGK